VDQEVEEESILHGILEQRIALEEHDLESDSKENESLSLQKNETTNQTPNNQKNDATSLFTLQLNPDDSQSEEEGTQEFDAQRSEMKPNSIQENNNVNTNQKNSEDSKTTTTDNCSRLQTMENTAEKNFTRETQTNSSQETKQNPNTQLTSTKKSKSSSSSSSSSNDFSLAQRRGDNTRPLRYFIMKSLSRENLEISVRKGVWATQPHNESKLNEAFSVRHRISRSQLNTHSTETCRSIKSELPDLFLLLLL
jgi:hypothetical protein